ncbi:TPA: hypothetical protein ACOQ31_005481 [Bacillus cereus]|uniref:hypothetical protein n=1 Tax=Bacillus cereus TaxID=1396 RepID=UPI001928B5D0|nr:hypothetical protein [Bacillus cereus]MBL3769210.1 hypothetical protein [Bacillus cereus]MBL3774997.1 hypothetical protein [Bacillus cereus]MBL3780802.1 hypothetical protein [Bacillus cereus]MBL3792102.1 hypothetical protein [Bacillus cereus]
MKNEQIYLGKPQTNPIEVCTVERGQKIVLTQIVLNNSTETDQEVTFTINTIDVMTLIAKGKADLYNMSLVLKQGDRLLLKQQVEGAVNVMINGVIEDVPVSAAPNYQ